MCIKFSLSSLNGIITDYKDWYFTRFDLSKEIAGYKENLFELSERIDLTNRAKSIDKTKLAKIVNIIE